MTFKGIDYQIFIQIEPKQIFIVVQDRKILKILNQKAKK